MKINSIPNYTHNVSPNQQIAFKGDYQTVQKDGTEYVLIPKKEHNLTN